MRDALDWAEAGKSVYYSRRAQFGGLISMKTIERVTPTMVVLDDGTRFNKATGKQVKEHDTWHPARIAPNDDEQMTRLYCQQREILLRRRVGETATKFFASKLEDAHAHAHLLEKQLDTWRKYVKEFLPDI